MFAGLAVVIITIATTGWIGRVLQRLQRQILTFKGSRMKILNEIINGIKVYHTFTVLPAKSDSDFMFCLQSYHGLIIDRLLVY